MTSIEPPYDRRVVEEARLEDLDMSLVEATIQAALQLGRDPTSHDPLTYLERYRGVLRDGKHLRPTVAGVMAFAREPDRWLTSSGIDIAFFDANRISPTASRVRQIRGPIFHVIDTVVSLLRDHCATNRLDGARLISDLDTPLIVLRELSTNAVVHRDLSVYGSQVRVQVYPTVLDWISPGGLPPGITVDTLLTAQFARNPSLAQFLFHGGYIEKFGMGLDAVIEALRVRQVGDPEFYDDKHSFRVRVRRAVTVQPVAPDLRTHQGRVGAIMDLFTRQRVWQQHEMLANLDVSRSTLQRDLNELVRSGKMLVHGATKSRVYMLPNHDPPSMEVPHSGFASDEAS